jgi:hypothetical protein
LQVDWESAGWLRGFDLVTNSRRLNGRGLDNATRGDRIPEIPAKTALRVVRLEIFRIYDAQVDRFFPKP